MPLPQDQGGTEQCPSPGKLETIRKQTKCFPDTWILRQEFEVLVMSCTAALERGCRHKNLETQPSWKSEKIDLFNSFILADAVHSRGAPDETAFPTIPAPSGIAAQLGLFICI